MFFVVDEANEFYRHTFGYTKHVAAKTERNPVSFCSAEWQQTWSIVSIS